MMPAVCLGLWQVNKGGYGVWDVSIANHNEIHNARIRKSFILQGTPAA